MKLGIMQPYLFPYIGYFQLINAADKFIFYDDVNFIKQGWINRNRLNINGAAKYFTVPIKNVSSYRKIYETEIDNSKKWNVDIINTIKYNYSKAPYYATIYPMIENLFSRQFTNIAEIAEASIRIIAEYLNISTELIISSENYNDIKSTGQTRIIDICLREKVNEYLNAIGGRELYQKKEFLDKGVELKFLKSRDIVYEQFDNTFVPWLSIIDVLMFNSKDTTLEFLNQYDFI